MNLDYEQFQKELDIYYPYHTAGAFRNVYRYSHWLQIQLVCELFHNEFGSHKLLLDAGCACGPYSMFLSNKFRVIGVDLSRNELEKAKVWRNRLGKNLVIDFVVCDIQHLPFKESVFDMLLCSEVLEHLPNMPSGLQELYRLIKTGGVGVISMPNYLSLYYILQRFLPVVTSRKENPHLKFHFRGIRNSLLSLSSGIKICVIRSSLIVPVIPFVNFYQITVKLVTAIERKLNKTPLRNVGSHYMLKFRKTART